MMAKDLDVNAIVDALSSAIPKQGRPVALHEPQFAGNEWRYLKECLDSGWVSSGGKFVDRFERQVAEFIGSNHAVAVVNGTSALHICLKLAGVTSQDEVLVPALTFVATANAVAYCGAVPHFVDSDFRTLGLDPFKLDDYLSEIASVRSDGCFNKKTGARIKAVVPVHTFGHPVDMDPLIELCARFKLQMVEDAAESLGSYYQGRHTGNWGRASALSFNGNKIVTTGGGGMIVTNDKRLAAAAKHITTTSRIAHRWSFSHDQVGYNYRMPNVNAALGCAQLERMPEFISRKRRLADRYQKIFSGLKGIQFFSEPENARSNYWLNILLLDERYSDCLHTLLDLTHKAGIMCRPTWTLMHKLPMYKTCPHMPLEVAISLEGRILNIPSSACLDAET